MRKPTWTRRDHAREHSKAIVCQAIERPSITAGMLAALWPDGVPVHQLALLTCTVRLCDGMARAVHGGSLDRAPLLDVAADALAGHLDQQESQNSEMDRPIAYSVAREDQR